MAASDFSSPSAGSFRSTQGSPDVAYEIRQTLGMGSFGIVKLAVSLGPYVLCFGFYVKFQDSLRAPLICAYLNIINPILINTCRIAKSTSSVPAPSLFTSSPNLHTAWTRGPPPGRRGPRFLWFRCYWATGADRRWTDSEPVHFWVSQINFPKFVFQNLLFWKSQFFRIYVHLPK